MAGNMAPGGGRAAFSTKLIKFCHADGVSPPGETAMLRFVLVVATIAIFLGGLAPARAGVVVTVDKSAQRLTVAVDGATRFEWPVSTARIGYHTPNGNYRPQWLARKWYSRKYDWSPMPYSIFFNEGYAIHGSYEISHLGRPASHGCIRLHPKNAAVLFGLVQDNIKDTQIVVTGEGAAQAARQRRDNTH
jgi:lipoprotein-anchoring transpeptidase ErfK/SrfK